MACRIAARLGISVGMSWEVQWLQLYVHVARVRGKRNGCSILFRTNESGEPATSYEPGVYWVSYERIAKN